ncbi:MAG: hypothetical protein DI586_08685 [Micavibrio aeruginosavorus]|uniref:Uncharacterized protein n=1 Tax=Micavibrio aeruginosavorus TaxID=349221 RepID=A0A2W5H9T3_9BACT|nr:MAG: hypothetical protein DI586_08685 [Micavibrio aeruginosavorus]
MTARSKNLLLALFIVVALSSSVYGVLYKIGHGLFGNVLCEQWYPGMPPERKIAIVLQHVSRAKSVRVVLTDRNNGKKYDDLDRQTPIENPVELLLTQPGCCRIFSQRTAGTDNPSQILSKGDEGVVVISYRHKSKITGEFLPDAKVSESFDYNDCKNSFRGGRVR